MKKYLKLKIIIALPVFFCGGLLFAHPYALSSEPDWKMISPQVIAGHMSVAVDPTDADTAYTNVDMIGLYKSTDRGMHWIPIGNDEIDAIKSPYSMVSKNIVIQKDNPQIIHVSRLVGFSKSINGGIKGADGGKAWQPKEITNTTGKPINGAIAPVVIDPRNSRYLYAGSGLTGRGWNTLGNYLIFKSEDSGETWTAYNVFPEPTVVNSIIPDPNSYNTTTNKCMTIYMSTDRGLWVSSDGGAIWNKKTLSGLPHEFFCRLVLIPHTSPPKLFLLVQPDSGHQGGVYMSEDDGNTWNPKNGIANSDPIKDTSLHPELKYLYGDMVYGNTSGVLYLSLATPGFFNGTLHPECPGGWRQNYIYLFKTNDWGANWSPMVTNAAEQFEDGYFGTNAPIQLAVSESDPSVIYAMGETPAVSSDSGAHWRAIALSQKITEDPPGLHWKRVKPNGLSGGCTNDLKVGSDGRIHYLDTDEGIFYSPDRGEIWNNWRSVDGIYSKEPGMVAVDPDDPGIFYISTGFPSTYTARFSAKRSDGTTYLIPGGIYKGRWYIREYGWTIFKEISNKGILSTVAPLNSSFSTFALGAGTTPATRLIIASNILSDTDPRTGLEIKLGFNLYRSDDAGDSWTKLDPKGLPIDNTAVYITHFLPHPTDRQRMLCVIGPRNVGQAAKDATILAPCGVYESLDKGEHWTAKWLAKIIFDIKPAPGDFDTQYLAIYPNYLYGKPEYDPGGIYKTTDNYHTVPNRLLTGYFYFAVAINPKRPNFLYAAVGPSGGSYPNQYAGVLRSTDAGLTWQPWNKGFVGFRPNHLAIDPNLPYVYIGTQGCGIWKAYDADVEVLYGDVSGNGRVSAYDAALCARIALGIDPLGDKLAVADVSGDDWVTLIDAALIVERAVGLISNFPVES